MAGLLAVLLSFSLYVFTHWVICRTLQWRPHSRVMNVLWLCFVPVYALLFFLLARNVRALVVDVWTVSGAVNFLNGLVIDVLLFIGYTDFFFLIERGLSLRVLIEIYRSPQQKMTIEDINKVYSYDYILEKRLGQVFKMGYAVKEGDYIRNTDKGSKLAAAMKLVRRIFNIEQVM